MRNAYIGLSSPIFYDYRNLAQPAYEGQRNPPNPILDGPFGLLLFFDQLWFLTKSLCPQNMRSLPYVRYVDETDLLEGFEFDASIDAREVFGTERVEHQLAGFKQYERTVLERGITWWDEGGIDNHSLPLSVPGLGSRGDVVGSSMMAARVHFDLAVVNHLGSPFEFITNSFTDRLLSGPGTGVDVPDYRAGESILLVRDIPNYQAPHGPYHPCIEELRGHHSLSHFRRWIADNVSGRSTAEIREAKDEVEAALQGTVRAILRGWFDPRKEMLSLGKTFLGWGMDLALPGSGKLFKLRDAHSEHKKKESLRWQGFILDARMAASGTTGARLRDRSG